MFSRLLLLGSILVSSAAFAVQDREVISMRDPDFGYYLSAINLTPDFIASDEYDFHSDLVFRGDHPQRPAVSIRVVVLKSDLINSHNLVLKVNGKLYLVQTELDTINQEAYDGNPFRVYRRWSGDEAGVSLRLQGTKRDPRSALEIPVEIRIKLTDLNSKALTKLGYLEDRI